MTRKVGPWLEDFHRRWIIDPTDALLPPRPPLDHPSSEPENALIPEDESYCPRCGRSTAVESLSPRGCPTCRGVALPWQRVVRLGAYREPTTDHLKAMKFGKHWRLADPWGRALSNTLREAASQQTVVTWVPLHWTRRWKRGYDQSRLIAEAIAIASELDLLPTLKRIRRTPAQSLLPESKRRQNVTHAFASRKIDLSGHRVVLVDDVLTTGSTAGACCRLLNEMGAQEIIIAVVAVTQRNKTPTG